MGLEINEYEKLLNEFLNFIRNEKKVKLDKIISWAKSKSIGVFTLSMLIDDLVNQGVIQISKKTRKVKAVIGEVKLPEEVFIRGVSVEKAKKEVEKEEKTEEKVQRWEIGGSSIVTFFGGSGENLSEENLNEDLLKAIEYLNNWWSVGEIRFTIDLMAMGVKNPEKVIRELVKRGYAVKSDLGVINATDKLPRIKKSVKLSDIFS